MVGARSLANRSASSSLALTFILVTVTLDAIGIGLIFPVMPKLIITSLFVTI